MSMFFIYIRFSQWCLSACLQETEIQHFTFWLTDLSWRPPARWKLQEKMTRRKYVYVAALFFLSSVSEIVLATTMFFYPFANVASSSSWRCFVPHVFLKKN